jgi:hypothetical protein
MSAAVIGLALIGAGPSRADDNSGASATVRLIQLLIEKGILSKDQAASLLKQAQEESRPPPRRVRPRPTATQAAAPSATPSQPAEPPSPAVPPGTVRVTYVPQIVRDQIAQEVRQEVMQQAQTENWAAPDAAPEWTRRIHFYGDLRVRGERDQEASGNGPIIDFNSINSGSGFDTSGGSGLPPTLNSQEDRSRFRVRARLAMDARIDDWVNADIGIATGNDASPGTYNQTLGSGGDFQKYALWLDRAYLLLQPFKSLEPFQSLKMYLGREPNPFWTTDLIYANDLNMDGAAFTGSVPINSGLSVFGTAGAFSVFNTAFNYSSLDTTKFPSHDKYLFAGQAGVAFRPIETLQAKLAAGFFAYDNINGKLSDPCLIVQTGSGCDTDATAAQYVQYGNTMFPIRNIVLTGTSTATPEYFGLASRFGILDLHGRLEYRGFPLPVALEGEFDKNLAFNRSFVASRGPVNNLGSNGVFSGGDTAYMIKFTVGKTEVVERWDWNAFIAYKYLQSDSVLDALNDADFHLGGTNAKGFILGGDLAVARNLFLTARWFSATQVSGTPYANDLVQVDMTAKF